MYFKDHPELPDWQRRMAIQQWQTKAEVEPEVFERLVALTYRVTGVETWVARVYASMFWMIGAAFLFLLVREQVSGVAALVSAAYFIVFPYAVIASRSFQPDVLMVMLVIMFWWLYMRWARAEAWTWAAIAGVVGGLAIYVKFVAVFFVVGAALGLGLSTFGRELPRKRQIWLMAALGVLPAAAYLYYGIVQHDFLRGQFSGRFIPALLLEPINYLRWAEMANRAAGVFAIVAGLVGLMSIRNKSLQGLLIGLWGAYLVYGLFFDYHIGTHDYYHLPLHRHRGTLHGAVGRFCVGADCSWCLEGLEAMASCCHVPLRGVLGGVVGQVTAGCGGLSTSIRHVGARSETCSVMVQMWLH